MDYGDVEANLDSTWTAHQTQDAWNYVYGPRKPDSNPANLAADHTHNYPLDGPLSTPDKVDCPPVWSNTSYRTSVCP